MRSLFGNTLKFNETRFEPFLLSGGKLAYITILSIFYYNFSVLGTVKCVKHFFKFLFTSLVSDIKAKNNLQKNLHLSSWWGHFFFLFCRPKNLSILLSPY